MNPRFPISYVLVLALSACSTGGSGASGGSAGVGGAAGAGGSGPCKSSETVVEQLVPTDIECSLSDPATQCEELCEIECAEKGFDLGVHGSGCAMEVEGGAFCRCVCAYCRAR